MHMSIDLYTNVQRSYISDSQKLEAIQMSTRCLDEQTVAYPFSELLLSNKKERTMIHATTWMNLRITMFSERSQTK